ncbi:unnamed protein product, partial [Mesorhabditis spiculigera]
MRSIFYVLLLFAVTARVVECGGACGTKECSWYEGCCHPTKTCMAIYNVPAVIVCTGQTMSSPDGAP